MAEFIEVIKHLKRINEACGGQCNNCALKTSWLCNHTPCECDPEGAEEAEQIIMKWAAEHPEPVYPTWREWLIKNGLIDFKADFQSALYNPLVNVSYECLNEKASEPIPADIAKKLGIKPKGE